MLETYSLAIQRRLHIDRVKNNRYKFYGGSNWCSLSNRGAHYVAEHYSTYRRAFWFTQISDEAVFQTIMMDSAYKNNIFMPEFKDDYMANIRYIDWKRGNPYIFTKDDFDELINSSCMFARKFDEKTDSLIIEKLYRILSENIEE